MVEVGAGQSSQALSGKAVEPSVVATIGLVEYFTANASCSGILVEPKWALTSAHCGGLKPGTTIVRFPDGVDAVPQRSARVLKALAHPCYRGSKPTFDVMLVELEDPLSRVAADGTIVDRFRQRFFLGLLNEDSTVWVFGRGPTSLSAQNSGVYRGAVFYVEGYEDGAVRVDSKRQSFPGDSGGPYLVLNSGANFSIDNFQIFGVNSQATVHGNDKFYSGWIDDYSLGPYSATFFDWLSYALANGEHHPEIIAKCADSVRSESHNIPASVQEILFE